MDVKVGGEGKELVVGNPLPRERRRRVNRILFSLCEDKRETEYFRRKPRGFRASRWGWSAQGEGRSGEGRESEKKAVGRRVQKEQAGII